MISLKTLDLWVSIAFNNAILFRDWGNVTLLLYLSSLVSFFDQRGLTLHILIIDVFDA